MDVNERVGLLHKVDIFSGVSDSVLLDFARQLSVSEFAEREPIILKGETGSTMYVIAEGKIKIHDGDHVVATMQEGSFFGEFSMLDTAPRSMSVTALTRVKSIVISRFAFFRLLQSYPEIAQKIIGTLTQRVRKQNDSIISQLKSREEELTRLVDERTHELKLRNEEISLKNKEITDNLRYAKRIQSAILPDPGLLKVHFPDSFILYLPKDIVSGDFYALHHVHGKMMVTAADCTGHGVTGAFLSVIGSALINQGILEKNILIPSALLDFLNEALITSLRQRDYESSDGMDVCICLLDPGKLNLQYAGANRPLWLIRNGEAQVFAPDKYPVGGMQVIHDHAFTNHSIPLQKGDCIYLFSDGYADQFGGESGKKMMTKNFRDLLLSLKNKPMSEQESALKNHFETWRNGAEQTDDVLVIGIRI